MSSPKIIIAAIASVFFLTAPSFPQTTSLQDIQELPSSKIKQIDTSKAFSSNHWAYRTLQDVSKKYGLLIGNMGDKFSGNSPMTRNEAAVLLVNLVGKIEQDKLVLSESEKAKMEILREELSAETDKLTRRMAAVETSVETLSGKISNLEKSDSKNLKFGYGDSFKITSAIQIKYSGNVQKGSPSTAYPSNFSFPLIDFGLSGKFNKNLEYKLGLLPSRNIGNTSSATTLLGDAYVVTDIVPNHKIYLGQTRVPIGVDGTASPYTLQTIDRSMIAKNFSDTRDLGIKVQGETTFVDYRLGGYNGARNLRTEANTSMDLATWINVKPLAKLTQYGKLDIGAGHTRGQDLYKYHITGIYTGYKYKKAGIYGEYSFADGYNGIKNNQKANGYYVKGTWDLNDKIQFVARFDKFDPNRNVTDDDINEYTAGLNYFMSKQNLKFMMNYVYADNAGNIHKNSQRILLLSQYLL